MIFVQRELKKKLKKDDSVSKTEVSLEKGEIVVHLKENGELSDEELTKIILDNGISVEGIRRE